MSMSTEGPVGKANRRAINEQFDLFLPYIVDLPLRDQREMMDMNCWDKHSTDLSQLL